MIFELAAAFEEDGAFGPCGDGIAFLVADLEDAGDGTADRALFVEPLLRGDKGEAVTFGARIIFHQHRAPPGDHLFLDRDRAGGGGVDSAFQR